MELIAIASESRETVEEFVARGGQIMIVRSHRAVGAPSPTKIKVKGGLSSNYLKNRHRMGYKISSVYHR